MTMICSLERIGFRLRIEGSLLSYASLYIYIQDRDDIARPLLFPNQQGATLDRLLFWSKVMAEKEESLMDKALQKEKLPVSSGF